MLAESHESSRASTQRPSKCFDQEAAEALRRYAKKNRPPGFERKFLSSPSGQGSAPVEVHFSSEPLPRDRSSKSVTTIKVLNVPTHTTEADFNSWFLCAPGFEVGTVIPSREPGASQTGRAKFSSVEAAQGAINILNGRPLWNCPKKTRLKVEWAMTDLKASDVEIAPSEGDSASNLEVPVSSVLAPQLRKFDIFDNIDEERLREFESIVKDSKMASNFDEFMKKSKKVDPNKFATNACVEQKESGQIVMT